jgi:signal transduction histidine kinase
MGAAALATDSARSSTRDYALYDTQGRLLAPAHQQGRRWPAPPRDTGTVRTRRIEGSGRGQVAAMYGPVAFEGGTRGILAVRRTTARAYSAARRARNGLAFILLGAMALTVLIGSGLARSILRQIRATLQTIGALGGGDLSARAPIINEDELGELARGVNTMAAQLETSYETLEQRVSERTDEVRQLLQQRSEFFAALSHELRTPLAVIVAQSDLLLEDGFADAPGAVQETGATVRASAQQLLDAVNQILEFAKTESGDVEVDLAPVSVADTFGDLEHTVDGLVRGSGLTLEFVVADDVPLVLADASRLRAVLLNLVGNAVKYTPAGGTVTVSASKRNGSVAIEVRDTGVGVPAEVGDRIFEPFYRVRSTRTQRGEASTGLGLALTKRLVEMQHGEISYTSTPKRGTTFTVTLPLAPNSNGKRSPSSARVTRG